MEEKIGEQEWGWSRRGARGLQVVAAKFIGLSSLCTCKRARFLRFYAFRSRSRLFATFPLCFSRPIPPDLGFFPPPPLRPSKRTYDAVSSRGNARRQRNIFRDKFMTPREKNSTTYGSIPAFLRAKWPLYCFTLCRVFYRELWSVWSVWGVSKVDACVLAGLIRVSRV